MTPTPKLRFVERQAPAPEHGPNITKGVRVLQQWWALNPKDEFAIHMGFNGEWRDVPMEVEK